MMERGRMTMTTEQASAACMIIYLARVYASKRYGQGGNITALPHLKLQVELYRTGLRATMDERAARALDEFTNGTGDVYLAGLNS